MPKIWYDHFKRADWSIGQCAIADKYGSYQVLTMYPRNALWIVKIHNKALVIWWPRWSQQRSLGPHNTTIKCGFYVRDGTLGRHWGPREAVQLPTDFNIGLSYKYCAYINKADGADILLGQHCAVCRLLLLLWTVTIGEYLIVFVNIGWKRRAIAGGRKVEKRTKR